MIDCIRARIPADDEAAPEELDAKDPGELLARQDEARDLWVRPESLLPEGQFQALWLRYAEDMDIEQIAGALGKTRTHIKVLLFRARHTLAGKLEAAAPSPALAAKGANP